MRDQRAAVGLVLAAMVVSAVVFGRLAGAYAGGGDVWAFADAGSTLLSTGWLHAFHVPAVQAGPLELVPAALARDLGGSPTGFAIVLDVVSWGAVAAAAASLLDWRALDLAVFACAACAVALPGEGYRGHPADLAIGALWLLAAREARRGRTTLAGALVGISTCFEVWGLLGVTVLALAPSLRRCGKGLILAMAIPVAVFLPFVAGGDFRMFQYRWTALRAPATLLVGYGQPLTWPVRVGEGAIVVLAGVAAARALRRLPESVWIVPTVTILVRIALDPLGYGYYFDPALIALLVGGTGLVLHPDVLTGRIARLLPAGRAAPSP